MLLASAVLASCLLPGVAVAQTADVPSPQSTAPAAGNADTRVEDIVVTARKTEENLQKVPVAVTAVTSAAIKAKNLTDIRDIAAATPGLTLQTVGRSGAAAQPAIFLRGIGLADNVLTADPAVGMYVDGVYLARNIGNILYLGDIQRVEILRGPQGTLFGKNTIGGAINITSNPPTDRFDASAEVTIGDYARRAAKGMINIPITSNLFLRTSGFFNLQDGYIKLNNYPGRELGDDRTFGAQAKLRWLPTANLTIDLGADFTHTDNTGTPNVLVKTYPNGAIGTLYNARFSGDPTCTTTAGQATNPVCFGPVQIPTNIYRSNEVFYDINGRRGPLSFNHQFSANLWAEWRLPFGTVNSITSYRDIDAASTENLGYFAALFGSGVQDPNRSKVFSQELRLSGKALDDRLSWVIGGYYFREHILAANDFLTPLAASLPFNSYPRYSLTVYDGVTTNTSLFGQLTFNPVPWLRISGGGRWTYESKAETATITPAVNSTLKGALVVRKFTPAASIAADLTKNVTTYLSYAEGFRSGGFPTRIAGTLTVIPSYGPEAARTIELGLKTQLFDSHLRANFALFDTRYTDIQLSGTSNAFNPPQPTIINAGTARIQGAEAEAQAVFSRWFSLDGSVTYLNPKLIKVNPTANDSGFPLTSATRFTFSPRWKASVGSTITVPVGDGSIALRGDLSYTGKIYFNLANTIWQNPVTLINASIAFRFPDKHWELVAGVKNLTDKVWYSNGFDDARTYGFAYKALAQPRTVFATLRWKY